MDIGTVVTHILRSDSINYSDHQLESQTPGMEGECLVFQTESQFHSEYCLLLQILELARRKEHRRTCCIYPLYFIPLEHTTTVLPLVVIICSVYPPHRHRPYSVLMLRNARRYTQIPPAAGLGFWSPVGHSVDTVC